MDKDTLTTAIEQFAADVIHELNTPVGGVIGFAQLLLDGNGLGLKERQDVETILAQGQRCRAIIQNLLLFSLRQPPKKDVLDLSRLIHSMLDTVRYDFQNFGVEVIDECPASLPPVLGDAGQLQQVFLHLLMSSRKALAGQQVKKLFIQGGEDAAGVFVRLRHTGRQIPEDNQKTDLAWSVCREILQKHLGALSVTKEQNALTTLRIELPIHD